MQKCIGGTGNFFQNPPKKTNPSSFKEIDAPLATFHHCLRRHLINVCTRSQPYHAPLQASFFVCYLDLMKLYMYVLLSFFLFYEDYLIFTLKPVLEVNFLVYLQSFASNIFFHQQTGQTTSKFFPFEMSMTISDIKIRTDISHSHVQPRRKMAFKCLIISINQHFT